MRCCRARWGPRNPRELLGLPNIVAITVEDTNKATKLSALVLIMRCSDCVHHIRLQVVSTRATGGSELTARAKAVHVHTYTSQQHVSSMFGVWRSPNHLADSYVQFEYNAQRRLSCASQSYHTSEHNTILKYFLSLLLAQWVLKLRTVVDGSQRSDGIMIEHCAKFRDAYSLKRQTWTMQDTMSRIWVNRDAA